MNMCHGILLPGIENGAIKFDLSRSFCRFDQELQEI